MNSPKIDIYTKNDCQFCLQAKQFLHKHKLPYNEYLIGGNITREEVLEKFPQMRTAPIIVIDEQLVGGYTNLVERFGGEHKKVQR